MLIILVTTYLKQAGASQITTFNTYSNKQHYAGWGLLKTLLITKHVYTNTKPIGLFTAYVLTCGCYELQNIPQSYFQIKDVKN